MNHILIVLGDQLKSFGQVHTRAYEHNWPIFLCESQVEVQKVPSSLPRAAFFLSSMRHFAAQSALFGFTVYYRLLDGSLLELPKGKLDYSTASTWSAERWLKEEEALVSTWMGATKIFDSTNLAPKSSATLIADIACVLDKLFSGPTTWHIHEPSEETALTELYARLATDPVVFLEPELWITSKEDFSAWSSGRKELRMEYYYRLLRREHKILIDSKGEPLGGAWNFDSSNRSAYPKSGPPKAPAPALPPPNAITKEVLTSLVAIHGRWGAKEEAFLWPVWWPHAERLLEHFITHRLVDFGAYQDAMWTHTPLGFHSLLASAMNVGFLDPLTVCKKAQEAYTLGNVSIESAEGFIRQILGWREFMFGLYWLGPKKLREANGLDAQEPLPSWFYPDPKDTQFSAPTKMNCMRDAIDQSWHLGYAHHIQRLMVIGNFCLLMGIRPQEVQKWFLAVYVDALEWVELPNVSSMALYADLGQATSKPYSAGGAYIKKQSNYCKGCAYDPAKSTGPTACPMSTLYWDFMDRNQNLLVKNPRVSMIVNGWMKKDEAHKEEIRTRAKWIRINVQNI